MLALIASRCRTISGKSCCRTIRACSLPLSKASNIRPSRQSMIARATRPNTPIMMLLLQSLHPARFILVRAYAASGGAELVGL
jgi:hypothetical protein